MSKILDINKRNFNKSLTTSLLISILGQGCGGASETADKQQPQDPAVLKQVGMWISLLWFNDQSVGFYPWDQYTRIRPKFGQYSSYDEVWINYTIDNAEDLDVDYLILDDTNGVFRHDGVFDKSIQGFLDVIKKRNSRIKICIATGYEIYEKQDWNLFVKSINHLEIYFYNPAYYKQENKPLLLIYLNENNGIKNIFVKNNILDINTSNLINEYDKYGYKNYLPSYSVRYVSGGDTWLDDIDGIYGWKFDYPQKFNKNSMGVMPGWNRSHNELSGSSPSNRDNGIYYKKSWDRIIQENPKNVVITSWDDWAEETAIAPSDAWGDTYFNITKTYINKFKSH